MLVCNQCGKADRLLRAVWIDGDDVVRDNVDGVMDRCGRCGDCVAVNPTNALPSPRSGCGCCGFAVFNVPDDSPDGLSGGDVQACDECRTFTDLMAADALRAVGVNVVLKVEPLSVYFRVVSVNPRALPALRMLGILPKQ